jgi:radical SAM superfamily enzyme YgiQ (UPF0313 family)
MPYARFISKWFANVPNINLGIMQSFLSGKGKSVKTFHFHLDFLPWLKNFSQRIADNLVKLTEQFGVEYMGLDYIFASLLFEENYAASHDLFRERLDAAGLTMSDFEELRGVAKTFIGSSFSKIAPYLDNTKLIGFSCSHYQLSGSLLLCSMIKKAHPEIRTIIGGKDCSGDFAYEVLKNISFVDFVGISECEVTIDSVLEHIEDNGRDVYNVIFRDKTGQIKKAASKPNVSINTLPFPHYTFSDFPLEPGEIILPIEFGRGCPWKRCTFCPDESYNILCQAKKSDRVREEIEYYQSVSTELKNFFILDSDALKDPREIIKIARHLEGKNLNFIYAEFRAERMDREVLSAILRFGNWVSNFQIGIETFSEKVLQLMNKGVTALKNVEILKAAAELGVPVQFNLFTCFPGMTKEDMQENLRVMDLVTHILVGGNFSMFPGEFYLPTDCPIFLDPAGYRIKKHGESLFSSIFRDFPMPSYSNYPYPYEFDNDEEQYAMSLLLRKKVEDISNKRPEENFMTYRVSQNGLEIAVCRDGQMSTHILHDSEKDIYLSAVEQIQDVEKVAERLGIPSEKVTAVIEDFAFKGIILYSPDQKAFLSLAMG